MMNACRSHYVDDPAYAAVVARMPAPVRANRMHRPALYVVQFAEDKLIKIGRSNLLRERLRSYFRERGPIRIVFILPDRGDQERRVLDLCREWAVRGSGGTSRRGRRSEYHRPAPGLVQVLDRIYREMSDDVALPTRAAQPGAPALHPHIGV